MYVGLMKKEVHTSGRVQSPPQERLALLLLIEEITAQIDEIADIMSNDGSAALSRQMLRETCRILPQLDDKMRTEYYNLLVNVVGRASQSPRRRSSGAYARITVPAKWSFIRKIRSSLIARTAV